MLIWCPVTKIFMYLSSCGGNTHCYLFCLCRGKKGTRFQHGCTPESATD